MAAADTSGAVRVVGRVAGRVAGRVLILAAAGGSTTWLLGRAAQSVAGDHTASWIVGRASGITAYLLLTLVVGMGLVLAHPWRSRLRRPSSVTRIRLHVALAAFTLAFTVLHIVVLATDRYAGVGWRGALLPLGSSYRPVPVTLGVIGLYAGLLAGITAAAAGRLTGRLWWPLHKVAALALVLVWAHGLLAGSDTGVLRWVYAFGAAPLIGLALSRYLATTPADRRRQLTTAASDVQNHPLPGPRPRPGTGAGTGAATWAAGDAVTGAGAVTGAVTGSVTGPVTGAGVQPPLRVSR